MEPVRFLEAIIGLMQDDEIAIIGNALDVPAHEAAETVNKINPVTGLIIRASVDGDLVAYWKKYEAKHILAINALCEPTDAE